MAKALAKDERRRQYKQQVSVGEAGTSSEEAAVEVGTFGPRSLEESEGTTGSEDNGIGEIMVPTVTVDRSAAVSANQRTLISNVTNQDAESLSQRLGSGEDGACEGIFDNGSPFSSQDQMDSGQWDGRESSSCSSGPQGSEPEMIFGSPEQSLEDRRKAIYAKYAEPKYNAM